MTSETTTIKVPKELRDRLARRAGRERVTLAVALAHVLDEADERLFWATVRRENESTTAPERQQRTSNAAGRDDLSDAGDDAITDEDRW